MTNSAGQEQQPVKISFSSKEQVMVEADDDRFFMTQKEAARACKRADNEANWEEGWQAEFASLLKMLRDWSEEREGTITACYVTAGSDGLEIYFTTVGSEYCDEIDDDLTELDFTLTREFPKWPADTMHLPEEPYESRYSFFDSDHAIEVYGNGRAASEKS